ncbi:MAG: SDR family oxidoreductase, partial [Leeuwenhoekiella sp.]
MKESKENILVAGANGTTGRKIINLLKESQYFNPIALVRKEEQQKDFEKNEVETVLGDLEKDLSHVIKGIDKVIFAAGSGGNTSDEKTTLVDQEGAKRLIDVAKIAGVRKFVMLSSINADNPESSEKLQHYLKAKHNADEHLKNSGLNYTIVRPGTLTNNEGTGMIALQEKLNKPGKISREDVAKTIVTALNDNVANGETFEIIEGEMHIEEALKNA